MVKYNTAEKEASVEQVIDKSRFIGHIKPVSSREEADSFINEIKKKYRDATHNVPAMVLGEKMEVQWASDDGEPQGTSGAPIVQMLVAQNISNVAIVVTRYFGGIKLGTGGLVRAYTSTAKLALENSGIVQVKEMLSIRLTIDYTFFEKLKNMTSSNSFTLDDVEYLDRIKTTVITEPENSESVKNMITNLTSGKAVILSESLKEEKVKITT